MIIFAIAIATLVLTIITAILCLSGSAGGCRYAKDKSESQKSPANSCPQFLHVESPFAASDSKLHADSKPTEPTTSTRYSGSWSV
jgi:hypothetical protein